MCHLLCAVKQVLQVALGTELGDGAVRALVLLEVQPMKTGEIVIHDVVPSSQQTVFHCQGNGAGQHRRPQQHAPCTSL